MNEISILSTLEQLELKLEHLKGLSQVCASAFSTPGAFGNMNESEVEGSFLSIKDQAEEIRKECEEAIIAITDKRARLNY